MKTDERTGGTAVLSAAPAPAREERVSIVSGDRFCTQCGYNLVGQSVVREPHYGMIIARCPECATVAALQEYPLLGRWAGRWGLLFAVAFFIVLLGAWLGSSAAIFGFTVATAEETSRAYTRSIQAEYELTTAPPPTAPATSGLRPQIAVQLARQQGFESWWAQQDRAAVLAAHGGWQGAIDRSGFWLWIPATAVVFVIGVFWSVALIMMRRRYLPVFGLAILALAACFTAVTVWDWISNEVARAWWAGRDQVGPPVAILTLAYLVLPLLAGLLAGRSVVRLLVRALLPPRLRYSLALLWTTDGLQVPGARRG